MDYAEKFGENINELLNEEKINIKEFADKVGIALSEAYRYTRKECVPYLSTVIKIADCYNYSIDFLLGLIPFPENAVFKNTPPFSQTFKKLLNGTSRYKFSQITKISINRIDDWYNGKRLPSLENAIKLKRHFKISFDALFGRE